MKSKFQVRDLETTVFPAGIEGSTKYGTAAALVIILLIKKFM
jgi:hypothetical protein